MLSIERMKTSFVFLLQKETKLFILNCPLIGAEFID